MTPLIFVFFALLKMAICMEYEVERSIYYDDKIIFKTDRVDICSMHGAIYYKKTENTVTCTCPLGTTFHSLPSQRPACISSTAQHLGKVFYLYRNIEL